MKMLMTLKDLLYPLEKDLTAALAASIKELFPEPHNTEVKRICVSQKAEVDNDKKEITMYVSTRDMDRDNEVVLPKGIDVKQFQLSPVILEGHDYTKPQIGKATRITKDEYGVKMKIEFAPTDEGEKYWQLAKFMPLSASIGFIPTEIVRPNDAGFGDLSRDLSSKFPEFKRNSRNVSAIIKKATLLETSIVPVPANPNAIQLEVAKAVKEGKLKEEDAKFVCKAFDLNKQPEPEEKTGPEMLDAYFEEKKLTVDQVKEWLKAREPAPEPKPHAKKLTQAKRHVVKARLIQKAPNQTEIAEKVATAVSNELSLKAGKV